MKQKIFYPTWLLLFSLHFSPAANPLKANPNHPTVIPLSMYGDAIFIKATVNGITGTFLVDTGSPSVVLNSDSFEGYEIPWYSTVVTDMSGNERRAQYFDVKELLLGEVILEEQLALVLDLDDIERVKGIAITGILGYSAFQDLELLFDFVNHQLLLFPKEKESSNLHFAATTFASPTDSMDFQLSGHIPFIEVQAGGKTLRLGIDSGSEVNLLNRRFFKKVATPFQSRFCATGINGRGDKFIHGGILRDVVIGDLTIDRLEVYRIDLRHLNKNISKSLDGILGSPFLQQGKVAINYKRKKIYFWRPVQEMMNEQLAVKKANTEAIKK